MVETHATENLASKLTTPEGVYAHLSTTANVDDWNDRIREVKAANRKGGKDQLPSFWYKKFVKTGLLERYRAGWTVTDSGTFGA